MLNVFRPYLPVISSSESVSNVNGYSIESLTKDINIKPLHSHNDYWRASPFFDAVKNGCQSIESDIWYFPEPYEVEKIEVATDIETTTVDKFHNNDIYVGHNQIYLRPNLTLEAMYLDPLFNLLKQANPKFKPGNEEHEMKNSIYFNSPETAIHFWMDFKTDSDLTYHQLKPLLQRFIDNGFLAYYDVDSDKYIPGPIMITLTGNLPMDLVKQEHKRYTFLDAPLHEFTREQDSQYLEQLSKLSVVASSSMAQLLGHNDFIHNPLSDSDGEKLKQYFDIAHKYGINTRIWGGVDWPVYLRRQHNRRLWELGCDLINVDDLQWGSDF